MTNRRHVSFLLNGEQVSFTGDARRTLLTWLREERRLVGTKEGCAEGDCGACTVVLSQISLAGEIEYRPVNACILCLGALDGKEVTTVEALKGHPVQQAMVECHGSQCGFCTPGFVMALYAHAKSGKKTDLRDAIAGNLCRCTGYQPILEAGARVPADSGGDAERLERLRQLPRDSFEVDGFFSPTRVDELAAWLAANPDATILAGGTDIGLWITKQHKDLGKVAYIGRVSELQALNDSSDEIQIGGAVTYADAYGALSAIHPDIGELLRRLGAVQVRAAGTIAGNIANGSPIGDTMPVLLALGSALTLQHGNATREIPLDRFYIGYRKSVLKPGEFIRSVRIPKLTPGARFAAYKLSKRFDQDISAVCGAFYQKANDVRFAFGGMAATPARAPRAEAAYAKGVEAACAALAEDFAPISDMRASNEYRLLAAQALVRKFHAGIGARALLDVQ
ncbi:MAG TPA: xanthine dehydrogenase small subunit [Burkholderiales bacterium]|nr:xanthine dehydrogenase small subunit [Burkholderiales bacterium]